MSWLLFIDESGHDHRTTPYEVRGGIAIRDAKLWPLMQALKALEQAAFGTLLHEHNSEIKGSKLLSKDRFVWEKQGPKMDDPSRRKNTLNFFNSSQQGRTPRRHEFTAYGQACIHFVEQALMLLKGYDARLFASIIPCRTPHPPASQEILRKDVVFLLERYFYFLEDMQESGLIVMDQTDTAQDRKLVRQLENYFAATATGKHRAQWIVPVPLFVSSDMAAGVQLADVAIYILNWGYRLKAMIEPARPEITDFAYLLHPLIWRGKRSNAQKIFTTQSVVYVPDPYEPRLPNQKPPNDQK